MISERDLLLSTAAELFAARCAPEDLARAENDWSEALWSELEELGFPLLGIAEEFGGAGGTLGDAAAVARLTGHFAAPVPLADAMLVAAPAFVVAGLDLPTDGPAVAAPLAELELRSGGGASTATGRLIRVPYGRFAHRVIAGANGAVLAVDVASCRVEHRTNIAGEPRDTLHLDGARVAVGGGDPSAIRRRGALARACATAGALERMLELTALWVTQREQFGRPIGRFQAVQQQLAELAGEAAAASAAAESAVLAEARNTAPHAVAAAKVRVGEAAGIAASIAHQLHGAIGVTDEHELHHLTRRVWAWRDEFGAESDWARVLGERVLAAGERDVWALLTALA